MMNNVLTAQVGRLLLVWVCLAFFATTSLTFAADPADPAETESARQLYALLASNPQLQKQIREIASKLRCPICQGLSVKESESQISLSMRYKIGTLLQQGQNEQQVLNYFEQRYGEWILREPKKNGINLWLWWLPFVLLIGGAVGLVFWAKKHRHILPVVDVATKANRATEGSQ